WARQVDDRRSMMGFQRERIERCPSAERRIHPWMCSRTNSAGRRRRRSAGSDARLKQRSLRWRSSTPVPAASAVEDRQLRASLVAEASVALWHFVVQREACGLRDMRYVLRDYRVPPEVTARMGMLPQEGLRPRKPRRKP